jgi:putative endonuclease
MFMSYFVYVLKSLSSGRSYVGSTNNLQSRLLRHNNNESKATKSKGPWKLMYQEAFPTRSQAVKREVELSLKVWGLFRLISPCRAVATTGHRFDPVHLHQNFLFLTPSRG